MPDGAAVIYRYDGSFDGLLCCVFESYTRRETPADILPMWEAQATLFAEREIITDAASARRVFTSLAKRISYEAQSYVQLGFLTCLPEKAMVLFRFIRLGYRVGTRVTQMLADDTVHVLLKAVQALQHEAHLLSGFLRFSDYGGALAATIEPKNFVLPLMEEHFCGRYPEEHFLIYDAVHGIALTYRPYRCSIIPVESLEFPEADETELKYRRLWRQYYKSIAIESRFNPKCRMTHMPKRFWAHMTEFQEEGPPRFAPETMQKALE